MKNNFRAFFLITALSLFSSCQSYTDKIQAEYEAEELASYMAKQPIDISKGMITSDIANTFSGALKVYYYDGIAYTERQMFKYLDTLRLDTNTRNNLERYRRKYSNRTLGTVLTGAGCGGYIGGLYANMTTKTYTGESVYGTGYFVAFGATELAGAVLLLTNLKTDFDAVVKSFNIYIENTTNQESDISNEE